MIRLFVGKFRFSIPQFNSKKDYYKVLGLTKSATEADIKKSFFKMAKKYHPDISKGNKSHEAIFKQANEAYTVLSDSKLKIQYDSSVAGGSYNPFRPNNQYQQQYQQKRYQEPSGRQQQYQQQPGQQRYRWTQSSKPNWNDPNFQAQILNQLFRMHSQGKGRQAGNQQQFMRQSMEEFMRSQQKSKRQEQQDFMKRFQEQLRRSYEVREERSRVINENIQKLKNSVREGVVGMAGGVADLVSKAKDWWNNRKK